MTVALAELYCDASATTPPLPAVLEAMQAVYREAWANPSSLHGHGLAAAEMLERSRQRIGNALGAAADQLIVTSGATESVHLALLGTAARTSPARLVIGALEHPAVFAAADALRSQGWDVQIWPVGPYFYNLVSVANPQICARG